VVSQYVIPLEKCFILSFIAYCLGESMKGMGEKKIVWGSVNP
jgi:hypothetical protein